MHGNRFKKIKLLVKKGAVVVSEKGFDLLYKKFFKKRHYEMHSRHDSVLIGTFLLFLTANRL